MQRKCAEALSELKARSTRTVLEAPADSLSWGRVRRVVGLCERAKGSTASAAARSGDDPMPWR